MNPPTRQELIHHRPLGREHVRVLLLRLRLALCGRQTRSIVDRLAGRRRARRVHDASRVGRRSELVWLGQGAVLVIVFLGFGRCAGRGEAATGCVDDGRLLEGAECSSGGEAAR